MTVEDQKPKFILPKISDNVNGWGPLENDIPENLQDIPYTPFSKSERIGKIADWTSGQEYGNDKRKNYQRNGKSSNQYSNQKTKFYYTLLLFYIL